MLNLVVYGVLNEGVEVWINVILNYRLIELVYISIVYLILSFFIKI